MFSFQRYNKLTNYSEPYGSKYTHSYYDAVWSIAMALNATSQKLKDMGKYVLYIHSDWLNIIISFNS